MVGRGAWEDSTGALEQTHRFAGAPRREGDPPRARRLGRGHSARLARVARADRASSASFCLSIASDCCSAPRTTGLARSRRSSSGCRRSSTRARRTSSPASGSRTSRSTCARSRSYELVIDRLGWWYDLAREWVKKCALMDDVYLLNNPFTFQAMEKHSAYCAMIRLGLKVPETWMVPHKLPAPMHRREYMAAKLENMASRYNLPFDLEEIAAADRLSALHEALRRRPVGRRDADRERRRAARAVRRLRRAADAPAGLGRGLRRLRALALDRRRDDGDELRSRRSDARALPRRARVPRCETSAARW